MGLLTFYVCTKNLKVIDFQRLAQGHNNRLEKERDLNRQPLVIGQAVVPPEV